jgi:hypothetical protein
VTMRLPVLFAQGHLDLELEVVKMVYRKFEANPPSQPSPHLALAERLFDVAQTYVAPRLVLRDKYATVAALAIDAIVAMRSNRSGDAIRIAMDSTFKFFREMVADDLNRLSIRWRTKLPDAANWCDGLLNQRGQNCASIANQ